MNKVVLVLSTLALALPLLAINGTAKAASAHNLQAGTTTKNAYDSAASQHRKQMRMRSHHRRY